MGLLSLVGYVNSLMCHIISFISNSYIESLEFGCAKLHIVCSISDSHPRLYHLSSVNTLTSRNATPVPHSLSVVASINLFELVDFNIESNDSFCLNLLQLPCNIYHNPYFAKCLCQIQLCYDSIA